MSSPLGQTPAAGLVNAKSGRAVMIESIELAASHVVHDMERYRHARHHCVDLATARPAWHGVRHDPDLPDTVNVGSGDVRALAGGIAVALIDDGRGLIVAIPSLFFYRMFVRARWNLLVVELERESIKLVDALHSSRGVEVRGA